ncbi:ExeM/NucH family extracellular endonuclease [Spongisporangium articulatum]|uniref:ExeM/NucH family extracellular endonuclease n=1 Tax=Spongisporangium articulatum TaxID=3362603 RepID=A0ABW8AP27_9ACTN
MTTRGRLTAGLTGTLIASLLGAGAVAAPAQAAACTGTTTPIGAVQGSGPDAAITGPVTVRGVVVGDYEGSSPALRGFYLQDPVGDGDRATSDGIFVFEGSGAAVQNGDSVEVTGSAGEFQGQTQITSTTVTVCGPGAAVKPVDVRLPVASGTALERYEGMLVRLPQTLSVTEHFQLGRFGQVLVSAGGRLRQPTSLLRPGPVAAALQDLNDRNQLLIDDATNAQNPDPIVFGRLGQPLSAGNTLRGGDTVTGAVGVLTYTWAGNAASGNAYRLRPVGALGGKATFAAANPRPTGVPDVGGTVKVASANLLNYFVRSTGCTLGVAGPATGCRGANNAAELERQAAKEVAALTSLQADVVGVMEMANDGYGPGSSIADLTARLNAAGAGTWSYVDPDAALGVTDVVSDDAIKVALLYRADRVTPVAGTTLVDTGFDGYDRRPLAQTFTRTSGPGRFSVVVNHLKSKGCDAATGDDADRGDGQGCWNARRVAQAQALTAFVRQGVVPTAKDPDVLVIGDLNSYAEEDPVVTLEGAGFRNLVQRENPLAYSYAFDGQWGYLDHALASPSLAGQVTGAADVHINADEPAVLDYNTEFKSAGQVASLYAPDRFRTSDHDPVLIGLRLR